MLVTRTLRPISQPSFAYKTRGGLRALGLRSARYISPSSPF